jgi:hypothetical protein
MFKLFMNYAETLDCDSVGECAIILLKYICKKVECIHNNTDELRTLV